MNQFIESLARLYKDNKISKKTLDDLVANKKISKQEYEYILASTSK